MLLEDKQTKFQQILSILQLTVKVQSTLRRKLDLDVCQPEERTTEVEQRDPVTCSTASAHTAVSSRWHRTDTGTATSSLVTRLGPRVPHFKSYRAQILSPFSKRKQVQFVSRSSHTALLILMEKLFGEIDAVFTTVLKACFRFMVRIWGPALKGRSRLNNPTYRQWTLHNLPNQASVRRISVELSNLFSTVWPQT